MRLLVMLLVCTFALLAQTVGQKGYYRFPSIHNDTIVFTSEGDLWSVPVPGGVARRLTSQPAAETNARLSPDGQTIAFVGAYEGTPDVYTMPAAGGIPVRRTFAGGAFPEGWTSDGKLLVATTENAATRRQFRLDVLDSANHVQHIPLSQAAQGSFDGTGKTIFFTRTPFQGSWAKRYQGGTAEQIWKFTEGAPEAVPLTVSYKGTSKNPMWFKGRVYFASDRDGTMNLWSMDENGRDLRQHTRHQGWDIQSPQQHNGRIVYQLGADLHLYEIAANRDRKVEIEVTSDFDTLREHWIRNPQEYITQVQIAPDGNNLTIVARGRVFVVPAKSGRLVEATEQRPARYRYARMMPGNKDVLVLSTESGEVELWSVPANGIGKAEQLTRNGDVMRWEAIPSPDGRFIFHHDKANRWWLYDRNSKTDRQVGGAEGRFSPSIRDLKWSPDSRYAAWASGAENTFQQIYVLDTAAGKTVTVTSNRYNSTDPAWSADGKFLYFISDRALVSSVGAPWGARAPDPFFERSQKLYMLALSKGLRSPFEPADELNPDKPSADEKKVEGKPAPVAIDFDGLQERLQEVPVPRGNYSSLNATDRRLCWTSASRGEANANKLECLDIQNRGEKPETVMEGINSYQMSDDGKKLLVMKGTEFFVFDSGVKAPAPKVLADSKVNLQDWTFAVNPPAELKEAFVDAWRMHRDWFYDKNMHGVDWKLMKDKYGELSGRIRDRAELNNLLGQLISELSALHASVGGGDLRQSPDQIRLAALGARIEKDGTTNEWTVRHIYRTDPDRPDRLSPLARPGVEMSSGDVILAVNGRELSNVPHINEMLRNQAGKQVLLRVRPAGKSEPRDVIVKPVTANDDAELRYDEWEYTRRLAVEKASNGAIGYVHLRAMGPQDIAQWAEHFYPIFNRQGLIIDVRFNNGGNIDSWILDRLLRKAWMYWQAREGKPYWNMQFAFRGHMVALQNEWTASDGEAFTEGFRRLGLGKILGTRSWGGEIWLSRSNQLVDKGVASAGETGVFGPERQWLVEGHGVDPDLTVDNLPHATFQGSDAQLDAAVKHLMELISKDPRTLPAPPPYPNKSFKPSPVPTGIQ